MIIFFFQTYIRHTYPPKFTLNKSNLDENYASFLVLDLSIHNNKVPAKAYDKPGYFNCDFVNFPFLNCDASYGLFITQLSRFTGVCTKIKDVYLCGLFSHFPITEQRNATVITDCKYFKTF